MTNNTSIGLNENKAFVVKAGKVTELDPPQSGFGEQKIIWVNGVVDRVETKDSKKI